MRKKTLREVLEGIYERAYINGGQQLEEFGKEYITQKIAEIKNLGVVGYRCEIQNCEGFLF